MCFSRHFILNVTFLLAAVLLAACSDPRLIEQALPATHKAENSGTARVEIPAVYELAQIAYALGEIKHGSQSRAWLQGDYADRVQAYFGPHQNHPAIDAAYFERWPTYWSYRQNSLTYRFEGGKITPGNVYDKLWSAGASKFDGVVPVLQEFADETNFLGFFEENRDYYNALIAEFYDVAEPDAMRGWLEENFSADYDSYLIVISPLVGGAHNFAIVRDGDYAEAMITISAPNVMDKYRNADGIIEGARSLRFVRTIFTELDHNYVNPVSETYQREIKEAIGSVQQLNESNDYRSKVATFNEYVTWALYPLFVADVYGDEFVSVAVEDIDAVMVRRGFIKFPGFNAWVRERFNSELKDGRFEDHYEDLFEWFRQNS